MSTVKNIVLILALLLLGFATAQAGVTFSLNLGSGDYYQPVGDYDYLPYAYQTDPGYAAPRVNFYDMMSQYGVWVSVAPFGQVWKPYASNDWRPYTYGHWVSTQQYGQMWEGYEPWAWAGYHYGNWIYDRNYGWVWIPGYDWHPGRVTWARSYGSIGWMPTPPSGYDYSRGYLSNVGPDNQFGYNDNNFGGDYGYGNYNQGGPYNDPRYRDMYYNPGYNNVVINLWIFVDNAHYGYDNYADYSLGSGYTRQVFDQRMVRISNRQIDRSSLQRIVGQNIRETQVVVRELQTNKQAIRVVVPTGSDDVDRIRKNSKTVVRDIIAPGFAEKQKPFKGQDSRNKEAVAKIFHQENVAPKVETLTSEQIAKQASEASRNREQNRIKREQAEKGKLDQIQKESKAQGATNEPGQGQKAKPGVNPEVQKENQKQKQHDAQVQSDAAKQKQLDAQKQKQHDAQAQSDAAKQKQLEDVNAAQKPAHGKDAVEPAQTQTQASPQDSKDKKSKSKAKPKPKPPEDQKPPSR